MGSRVSRVAKRRDYLLQHLSVASCGTVQVGLDSQRGLHSLHQLSLRISLLPRGYTLADKIALNCIPPDLRKGLSFPEHACREGLMLWMHWRY